MLSSDDPGSVGYGRKDYFKICVFSGRSLIHYADKSLEVDGHALFLANPQIPYTWEPFGKQNGHTCIFTESYFTGFGDIRKYPFFQPGGYPVYELNENEFEVLSGILEQMATEKESDFAYKDDVLRNLVFQLVHAALKMRPSTKVLSEKSNAASRITHLFMELLESQFPIRNTFDGLSLRSASEFAAQMAIHANHLNKSVREITQKTTSEIIADRLLKKAKILLRHSSWAISEIAYGLGFEGPAHFSTFFKKQLQISPSEYRKH